MATASQKTKPTIGKEVRGHKPKPNKRAGRFKTTAKLGEVYGQTIRWEAEGIEIPILGMDNCKKLKLSVQQKKSKSEKTNNGGSRKKQRSRKNLVHGEGNRRLVETFFR